MSALRSSLVSAYAGYAFRGLYLLLLIPLYARTLGPQAYGTVLAAMAVQNLVWVVQNWGFSVLGARSVAADPDQGGLQAEFERQLSARLLMLGPALLVGVVAVMASPSLRASPAMGAMALASGVIAGFNLGWFFQGRLDFRTPVLLEILGFVLVFALVLALVHKPEHAPRVLAAVLAQSVLCSALAYAQAARSVRLRRSDWAGARALVRRGAPLFLSGGALSLLGIAGTYSLAALSTSVQVAYFSTAERVVATVLGVLGPLGQVLLPWFSGRLHSADAATRAAVARSQWRAVRWVSGLGLLCALANWLAAPPVIAAWLGPGYSATGEVLRVLGLLFLLSSFNQAMATYVWLPRGQDALVARTTVAMAVVGIASTAAGAWGAGALGAAMARVATELGGSAVYAWQVWQQRQKPAALGHMVRDWH